jgi:hypothetical protein
MTRAKWDEFGPRYEYLVKNYGKVPQREIAARLKLTRQQVRKWAHFLGLSRPKERLPEGHYEQLLQDYARMSLSDVARKHNLKVETVWSRIRTATGSRKRASVAADRTGSTTAESAKLS